MNYYIQDENEKIVLFNTDKQILQNDFIVHPEYANLEIKQTNRKIILLDNEFVFKDEVEDELTEQRKENFEKEFLTVSLGNYRLKPRGYANAQQSIDTINCIVLAMGSLTEQVANMIIFYQTPDFSKEEECSEEWLIQHQYSPSPMTKEEWTTFYIEFTTVYAQKQYQLELLGQNV